MGSDDRPVQPDWERKSVGAERTLREDLADPEEMIARPEQIAGTVARRLKEAGPEGGPARGRTVTLKLKSHEHEVSTRQTTLGRATGKKGEFLTLAERLLYRPRPPEEPVWLLGISVSSLTAEAARAFLFKNGYRLGPEEAETVAVIRQVVASKPSREALVEWLEANSEPIS
ncbi:MAG: hypothetical protein V5A22_00340 [Salinivenus sp.]